jgi:hypothetical protein
MYINKILALISMIFLSAAGIASAGTAVVLSGNNAALSAGGFPFQITIEADDEAYIIQGQADFRIFMNSYMIIMEQEDVGRCVLHMLNFDQAPGLGTYDVENTEEVRTAILCMAHAMDPQERLVSHSGTFTITDLQSEFIKGHFDMKLSGPISGKEFRVHGSLTAESNPAEFGPGSNPFLRQ